MSKPIKFLLLFVLCFALVGFTEYVTDLEQYRRLPFNVRLERLHKIGFDLFNRRRYEEARQVFESMRLIDENNLLAYMWMKKCDERLDREINKEKKRELIRKYGALIPPEMSYPQKHWGPMAGHFEVRYSEPKPYVPPKRKIRPRATDDELAKAVNVAGNDPDKLFELSMLHWSRRDNIAAIDHFEKAIDHNPDVLGNDDEGLMNAINEEIIKAMEEGKITSEQHLLAGRVAKIQGDLPIAVDQFIKTASIDENLKPKALEYLQKIVLSGKASFLFKAPETYSFRQAFIHEDDDYKVYAAIRLSPGTPHLIVPIDLTLERDAIKKVELQSNDVLTTFNDPSAAPATRFWIVLRDREDRFSPYEMKCIISLEAAKVTIMELSNFNFDLTNGDNWATIIAPATCFDNDFPPGQVDGVTGDIRISGFQLNLSAGKGPIFRADKFKDPLTPKQNVWEIMEKVANGSI